ncbi:hypothetical protein Btru_062472 [Bulinus truncatus]|nr:hypothetical protein Btru_062472 [Bulinus truncatus]
MGENLIVLTGCKDPYAYIGDNLQLKCKLNMKYTDKGCNSSLLTFKKKEYAKEYVYPNFTSVVIEKVSIISPSLAILILTNITENDAGSYSCFVHSCVEKEREIKTYKVSAQWDNVPYAVGDELNLYCKLRKLYLKKGCNASFLTFKKKEPIEEYLQPHFTPVNSEKFSIINPSTAVLNLTNITESDVGFYACFVNSCVEKETEIKTFEVSVQYEPHNVTHFNCILVNWNDYLFCSWEHPVHYVEQLKDTNISLLYNADKDDNENPQKCPALRWNNCTWSEFRGSGSYYFVLIVTNYKTNHIAFQSFKISTDKIAQPSSVNEITFQGLQKENCFNISWNYDRQKFGKFQLLHQGPEEEKIKIIADNLTSCYSKVCDMKPFTSHKFAVVCQALNSGLKSEPMIISYITPEKAPRLGPESVNGSYTSGKCLNNRRDITVFWKEVEREARNGIITSYTIRNRNVMPVSGLDQHQATIQLPCDSKEFVEILANNSAGQSQKPTVLLVAPLDFKVPAKVESSFAVERKEKSYIVQWDNYTVTSLTYTIYWVVDEEYEASKQQIEWKIIPKHQYAMNISEESKLKFGLSVTNESSGLTSSIVWTDCIYESVPNKDSLLAPEIDDITVVEELAIVYWTRMQCSKKYPYRVDHFVLLICEKNHCDKKDAIKFPTSASSYTVSGLQAGKTYWFALCVKFRDIEGPPSKWKMALIRGKASDLTNFYIIISICVLLLVGVFIFTSFLWRRCKAGHKKKKRLMSDENSDCPSTSYLLPEENSVMDKVTSPNHLKNMHSTVKNLFTLSQKNSKKLNAENIITECLLPFSSIPDSLPPSALNSQITELASRLLAGRQVENLQPYCVIKNMELECEERTRDTKLPTELSTVQDCKSNGRNVSEMINSVEFSKQYHCEENLAVKGKGFIVNHLSPYSKINLGQSSTISGKVLKSGKEKDDNESLLSTFPDKSEKVTTGREYVALNENNSLVNSSLLSRENSLSSSFTTETAGKNISSGSSNHFGLLNFNKGYILVNDQGSLVLQPSTDIAVPKGNNHSQNLNLHKDYVQVNEQGSLVLQPSTDIAVPNGNNHSQNLNLHKDYVQVNEQGSLVPQPSTDIAVPKGKTNHSQNLSLNKDYVQVNEQGSLVPQPSTDIAVPNGKTNHSQNLNLHKDYVQVNEQGSLVPQPSTDIAVPNGKTNHSQNLNLYKDYVQVSEKESVVHQPSKDIAVSNSSSNHSQTETPNIGYVQINKEGFIMHLPSISSDKIFHNTFTEPDLCANLELQFDEIFLDKSCSINANSFKDITHCKDCEPEFDKITQSFTSDNISLNSDSDDILSSNLLTNISDLDLINTSFPVS